jgi:ABC-type transporter Mla subunit MlaD
VGVFVLAGLLLFSVGLFLIGDRQMAFAKKFTVYTEFKKITGLQPGAIVRVSGAKAGSITEDSPAEHARREVSSQARAHGRSSPAGAHRLSRDNRDRRARRR